MASESLEDSVKDVLHGITSTLKEHSDDSADEQEDDVVPLASENGAEDVDGTGDDLFDPASLSAIYKQAYTKFNIKQKDCIKFLVAKGVFKQNDHQAIANFLHEHGDGLSKRRIGEYLGNIDNFNQKVLQAFLESYNFANKSIDESLRMILTEFRLPGEAQQIDRILEKFAARIFKTNPEIGFENEDTVYILSFSLIMLNTDLHNPNIAENKKMTLDGFVRNNAGINNGKDIDRAILEDLFNKIKKEQIRMNEGDQWEGEVVTFMAPNKSGWLSKANHASSLSKWKKHWFVLTEHVLYYFDSPGDDKPRLIMPMDSVRIGRSVKNDTEIEIVPADGTGFIKCTKTLQNGKMELQQYKDFVIKASNKEERDEWYESLRDDIEPDPVQRMTRERQRLQKLKKKELLKRTESSAMIKNRKEGKDSIRLEGRGLLELPPPVAMGFMHKRGESMTAWKRRFFALIDPPEEMNLGAALYYFTSQQDMERLLEIGLQTQKGQLFLEFIQKVVVATDKKDNSAIIQLVCEGRTWKIRPETPESFNFWMETLEAYVEKEKTMVEKRKQASMQPVAEDV
eukprot:CAMPEP_0114354854 /NCGR_PEP_ID=MMETSP0101-20121206/19787_1 /TAXON_ID=38822 ORGANISM="Pteridomonas danica, Strain PT" /NCGR_SAMPLE_ID=MMETSP0101 /ASSEMBLY_ACC=CAM_ASM_000211 /LENGTH=568 /DNA_ID=CAMNT_0001496521 /DNA_START=60 /DNA_END=1766 /DNA_ORIENTATION=+